jgi:hypothetical protein
MRMPQQQNMPQQQGNWFFNQSTGQWDCGCDDGGGFPGCPPPGWPPPGCPPWFSGMNSPPWYPGANAGVSFGNTAPANPVRGHFWWDGATLWMFDGAVWVDTSAGGPANQPGAYIGETPPPSPYIGQGWWNGSVLKVWDGSSWNLVGPGAFSGPVPTTTKVFSIPQPPTAQLPISVANEWVPVPWSMTPTVDTMSAYNATNYRYQPTKGGVYMFTTLLANYGGGAGLFLMLVKNDPGSWTGAEEAAFLAGSTVVQSTEVNWITAGGILIMNGTSDYVRLFMNSPTTTNVAGLTSNPALQAWLLP